MTCASSLIHKIWRCSHIYYCSAKFHRQNSVIVIGLCAIKSLREGDLYVDFAHIQADQQNAAWFESAIGMSCTSFDTEHFLQSFA